MAELFRSKDGRVSVSLYEKHTSSKLELGKPLRPPTISHCVELKLRSPLGDETAIEIDLAAFHQFFFREVFPAVARRIGAAKKLR